MPKAQVRLPQGEAPPPAPTPARGVRWWRAPDYECVNGSITPVGDPVPVDLDPQTIDWGALMRWGTIPAAQIPDATVEEMCAWCQRHGTVGYFMTSVTAIYLPLGLTFEVGHDAHEAARTTHSVTGEASPHAQREELRLESLSYHRVGGAWFADRMTGDDLDQEGYGFSGALEKDDSIHDHVRYDPKAYEEQGPLPPTLDDLAARCLVPIERCPPPNTPEFWALYQEPLTDMLQAGRLLSALRPRTTAPARRLYQLMRGTSWVLNQAGQPEMRVASLLNAYALTHVLRSHIVKRCACEQCQRPFIGRTPSQKYCTTRCENTVNQQVRRQARASAHAQSPRGPARPRQKGR